MAHHTQESSHKGPCHEPPEQLFKGYLSHPPSKQAFTPVLSYLDGPFIIWIRLATGKAANSVGDPHA